MSSFQAVSYGDYKRALHQYVGLSVSKEVFNSHCELMWDLYYYINLDFHALSSMDLSDEPSAAERRLKEIARVLIEFINLTSAKHNVRLYQHGKAIRDAVSLSNVCKDMAAILSTQEAKLVNKVAKITELVTKIAELDTKIAELEEQLRSSNTTVESQRRTIEDLNSEVATGYAQNLDANDEIREQGLEIQHHKDHIAHLQKTIAFNDDSIYNMEHQLVDLQNELQVKRKFPDQNTVGSPSDVTEVDVSHPNKSPKLTDAVGAGSSLFDSTPESTVCESEVDEESEEEKESEDEADNPNVDGSTVESAFPILDNPELPYSD